MAHTFEYDGVTVEYYPPIIKCRQARNRLMSKLTLAHGYADPKETPDALYDSLQEYASTVARSCARGAAWWVDSDATLEDVRKGFEVFGEQPEDLYDLLIKANEATALPKKTSTNAKATP